jgi:hypothetical protein
MEGSCEIGVVAAWASGLSQGGWDERGGDDGDTLVPAAPPLSVETSDVCDTSDVVYYLDGGTIFPPLARQFSFVVFVCPWPLQPFFPAQAWPLPWHDPEPLHELMPSQTTSSPALAVDIPTAPDANIPATAVAIMAPLIVIFSSPGSIGF